MISQESKRYNLYLIQNVGDHSSSSSTTTNRESTMLEEEEVIERQDDNPASICERRHL